jgi:hypothetical protein
MTTPEPQSATTGPLDAERARLRAQGWSEADIREILLRREVQGGALTAPAASGSGDRRGGRRRSVRRHVRRPQ